MTIAIISSNDPVMVDLRNKLGELGYPASTVADKDSEVVICRNDGNLFDALRDQRDTLLRVPAILVTTGAPASEDLIRAMTLGVSDVLTWPATNHELQDVIDRNLARSRARHSHDPALQQQVRDLERDQRAGHYIQMGMLPPNPMAIDNYRLRHRILPSLMLSGDFVDYFRITDHHFVFYIADVSGHGASSAFVTVILKNFSRRLRREYHPRMLTDPGEILVWLNREILENEIDKHVAMFIAVVDLTTDVLTYANAGHFPHAMHVSGGETQLLEISGKPIGLFPSVSYKCETATLAEGDNLVLLSDGVLEVMPERGLQAKEDRLMVGARRCDANIDELWQLIGVEAAAAGPDDMTCLMVTRGQ